MRALPCCAALLVLAAAGCHRDQVRLPLTPAASRHEWRDKVSARHLSAAHEELLYLVEAPIGYAEAVQDPLDGFVISSRMRWNDAVAPLQEDLERLAARHNAARISVQGFEQSRALLLATMRELGGERNRLKVALGLYRAEKRSLAAARAATDPAAPARAGRALAGVEDAQQAAEEALRRAAQLVAESRLR